MAHPGGNVTGFTNYEFNIGGKWLEILKEVDPNINRVLVILYASRLLLTQSGHGTRHAALIADPLPERSAASTADG